MQTREERSVVAQNGDEPEMGVLVSRPSDQGPYPVLLVIHEAFGIDTWVEDITKRFAAEGFVAVAPDLFSVDPFGKTVKPEEVKEIFSLRFRLPPERRGDASAIEEELNKLPSEKAERMRNVMRWTSERDMGALVRHVERAIEWSRQRDDTTQKVGIVGFCFGGGMVLRAAFEGLDLDAAAPFYGANPPLDKVGNVKCPLLLMYGRDDPYIMPQVPDLLKVIQEAELRFGLHIYEEAGHAFLNDQRPEMYSVSASKVAWPATIAFFKSHLGEARKS